MKRTGLRLFLKNYQTIINLRTQISYNAKCSLHCQNIILLRLIYLIIWNFASSLGYPISILSRQQLVNSASKLSSLSYQNTIHSRLSLIYPLTFSSLLNYQITTFTKFEAILSLESNCSLSYLNTILSRTHINDIFVSLRLLSFQISIFSKACTKISLRVRLITKVSCSQNTSRWHSFQF